MSHLFALAQHIGLSRLIACLAIGLGAGLALGIALTLVLSRLGAFRHPWRPLDLAAKLLYLYIPVLAALAVGSYAGLSSVQSLVKKAFYESLSEPLADKALGLIGRAVSSAGVTEAREAAAMAPQLGQSVFGQIAQDFRKDYPALASVAEPALNLAAPLATRVIASRVSGLFEEYSGLELTPGRLRDILGSPTERERMRSVFNWLFDSSTGKLFQAARLKILIAALILSLPVLAEVFRLLKRGRDGKKKGRRGPDTKAEAAEA
jgi:hypothetical protein